MLLLLLYHFGLFAFNTKPTIYLSLTINRSCDFLLVYFLHDLLQLVCRPGFFGSVDAVRSPFWTVDIHHKTTSHNLSPNAGNSFIRRTCFHSVAAGFAVWFVHFLENWSEGQSSYTHTWTDTDAHPMVCSIVCEDWMYGAITASSHSTDFHLRKKLIQLLCSTVWGCQK